MNNNIQTSINELHRSFTLLNDNFYDGQLEEPAILIMAKGKRSAYGWCTTKEVWGDKAGKIKKYEIVITAEHLDRDYIEILRTLHHEMIHLYNATNGIQDCSRGGTYHNTKFKEESERRGFFYDAPVDKKYGWTFSKLTDETIDIIRGWGIDSTAFQIARMDLTEDGSSKKKTNSYKWICPCCELTVRSTKPEINIKCGDCEEQLILEG